MRANLDNKHGFENSHIYINTHSKDMLGICIDKDGNLVGLLITSLGVPSVKILQPSNYKVEVRNNGKKTYNDKKTYLYGVKYITVERTNEKGQSRTGFETDREKGKTVREVISE